MARAARRDHQVVAWRKCWLASLGLLATKGRRQIRASGCLKRCGHHRNPCRTSFVGNAALRLIATHTSCLAARPAAARADLAVLPRMSVVIPQTSATLRETTSWQWGPTWIATCSARLSRCGRESPYDLRFATLFQGGARTSAATPLTK
jgi:hypothetical protein